MVSHVRIPLAVVASLSVLSFGACGGDDDDKAPSKADFVSQADAICIDADKKQAAIEGGKTGGAYQNLDNVEYLTQFNDATHDAHGQLAALQAPEEDEAAFDDLLASIERSADAMDDHIAALEAGDPAAQAKAKRELTTSYGDVSAQSGTLGLACQGLGN